MKIMRSARTTSMLTWKWERGTKSATSNEHSPKKCQQNILRLATFFWIKDLREATKFSRSSLTYPFTQVVQHLPPAIKVEPPVQLWQFSVSMLQLMKCSIKNLRKRKLDRTNRGCNYLKNSFSHRSNLRISM